MKPYGTFLIPPHLSIPAVEPGWQRRPEIRLGFPGVDFNKVYIITPVDQYNPDPNSMQEFMYIGNDPSSSSSNSPGASTPEPGTFVLLGTGAVALWRRKLFS